LGKRSQQRMLGLSQESRMENAIKRKEEERKKQLEEQEKCLRAFLEAFIQAQ